MMWFILCCFWSTSIEPHYLTPLFVPSSGGPNSPGKNPPSGDPSTSQQATRNPAWKYPSMKLRINSASCGEWTRSTEYIYPVAPSLHDGASLYVVQQKSLDQLQLWLWNSVSKKATQELCSLWVPAGFQLLSSGTGYGFVHNGLPRVKFFHKRSPKTIGLELPLYDIGIPVWGHNDSFLLHARHNPASGYAIFRGTVTGQLWPLVTAQHDDCLYPCLYEDTLFYIERDHEQQHRICSKNLHSAEQREVLVSLGAGAWCFLSMISPEQGCIVEHKNSVHGVIACTFHTVTKKDRWTTEPLFSFHIPYCLVQGSGTDGKRLHESLALFIPRYLTQNIINFIDYGPRADSVCICQYDVNRRSVRRLLCAHNALPVGLLPVQDLLYVGGRKTSASRRHSCAPVPADYGLVRWWVDAQGDDCFDIPSIPIHMHQKA